MRCGQENGYFSTKSISHQVKHYKDFVGFLMTQQEVSPWQRKGMQRPWKGTPTFDSLQQWTQLLMQARKICQQAFGRVLLSFTSTSSLIQTNCDSSPQDIWMVLLSQMEFHWSIQSQSWPQLTPTFNADHCQNSPLLMVVDSVLDIQWEHFAVP